MAVTATQWRNMLMHELSAGIYDAIAAIIHNKMIIAGDTPSVPRQRHSMVVPLVNADAIS